MLSNKIKSFLDNNPSLQTPFVIFDLEILKNKYLEFKQNFPSFNVFYAVKCNPAVEILKTLNNLGSSFDVASIEEVTLCLDLGIAPEKLSWGSTIKKASLIKEAYERGVKIYAFDSIEELIKISENAPNSKVYCRILVNNENALWPLSAKFGCSVDMALNLMVKAKELGLIPFGISFHVGSQQIDLSAWDRAISASAGIMKKLEQDHQIKLDMLNLGGGYPAYGYLSEYSTLDKYRDAIFDSLKKNFDSNLPIIFAEPGRFLVADAGVIKTEVVLVANKQYEFENKWVYLDIGLFGGLAETMGESIKYQIIADYLSKDLIPTNLAGPTCDGMDVLYTKYKYKLPRNLKSGDFLYILSTGAYTTTYSSVCFNGFKPLKDYYIE